MLGYRLLFGILMAGAFIGLVLADGWFDGSITTSVTDDRPLQGSIVLLLIILLQIPAHKELAFLAAEKGLTSSIPVTVVSSGVLAAVWYWAPLVGIAPGLCISYVMVASWAILLIYQYKQYGFKNVIGNCAFGCFAIIYLGLLAAFAMAIRIEFGIRAFFMYVFVVKFSDIGAYFVGRYWGHHKCSPHISPGKTWEGLFGAIATGTLLALMISQGCAMMPWYWALVFGVLAASIGQLGDLVESMLKRDALQKDSSSRIPGFGGVLDILDSLLAMAPVAYLLFFLNPITKS